MLRVGLTGGIASGKSEVSRRLAARGAVVIDSDLLARASVAAGTDGFNEVVAAFGPSVLDAGGQLDRPALARAVFADERARAVLESIVHPRVRRRADELEAAAAEADPQGVVVHDIPLLVETGQGDRFDIVIVVDATDETRLDRLIGLRGMSADEAASRMTAQATRRQRLNAADRVVHNDGDLQQLDSRVDELWELLRTAATAT
ncbi:MAG: dephospho-CoA kinase [Nocardioidaceae bacterium]|nr:dephospho-CoA kinase [Nocardioidaceae bacterium]MDQ3325469.1 dephospho-CoA kinase [Actinomycetota bacterium]